MDLKSKTAIVTGATKGIGRGIAGALLREGVSVCISARHQTEIDEAVKKLNQSSGGQAIGFACDVRDYIKVSYIMPGSVNTEFGGDSPSDEKSWQLTPADIARVVIDLLHHDDRSLPSRVEIRPSKPPKK